MGFFSSIFSTGVSEGVKAVSEGVGGLAIKIRTAITGVNPEKQAELEKLAQEAEAMALQGQLAVNKAEAQHRSVFVAGWRPAIGWVCALSLAAFFIPQYSLGAWIWVKACLAQNTILPFPMSANGLLELVGGMLGLGLLRTVEKVKDVQTKH
jgi:hypothetical protein